MLVLRHRLDGTDGISVRVDGQWRYLYRAVDGAGQTIDFLLSAKRDKEAARRTLVGIEAMAMLSKGQVRAVPANDIHAQRAFVHRIFGLAA